MGRSHFDTQPLGTPAPLLWYASLPEHVRRLYEYKSIFSNQPPLMVILAEVVCEAFTVWALEELFKRKKEAGLWAALLDGKKKRRFQDICDDYTNGIYLALSGDQITQASFWELLKKHNNRRNALVHPDHSGSTAHPIPSSEDADESIKAVEAYIQHVHGILKSIQS